MTHPEILHDSGEGPAPILPPAAPPAFPGREDVVGLRISAALVDLALLAGLFVIIACAVGQVSEGGGSIHYSLNWAWGAAFVAIAALYYFALEALSGQTVGKRLLGVQVYGPGRTRPSAWAVAGRTLLRVVDFLPVLYLVGFVTMMATGARRQRIGDLAARTVVARALPVRHRGLAVVPLAFVLLAAAGLSAYRVISPGTTLIYRAHGVAFDYPAGWQDQSGQMSSTSGGGPKLWDAAVGAGTPHDVIVVEAFRGRTVTAQNIKATGLALESELRQEGLAVRGNVHKITMAGLPGVRFQGTGTVEGTPYVSILEFAFSSTTEYSVNCQYTAGMATQVKRACDQVTGSFRVSRAAPAPGAAEQGSSLPGPAGAGGLKAKVVPAPSGFALSQEAGVHNGPMSAAGFNRLMGTKNLAAMLRFVRGYDVFYDSTINSDSIEVTLLQFATHQDAAHFKAGFVPGGPVISEADAVIPGARNYDSTSPHQGTYDHGVIAVKGNLAFIIDDATGSPTGVLLVEKMARQQYAAL
jgi:uncharacterized RDD family membrane protein YckC